MNTNLTNATGSQGKESACAGLETNLQPLLQEMLVGVRRHRETALLAGFNGLGIVTAALCSISSLFPRSTYSFLGDVDTVNDYFNQVILQTLRDQSDQLDTGICLPLLPHTSPAVVDDKHNERVAQWLAVWLEQFCSIMNEFHPQAIEVVILRGEGCDSRQVARRLGLTHRLVKRIVRDILQSYDDLKG